MSNGIEFEEAFEVDNLCPQEDGWCAEDESDTRIYIQFEETVWSDVVLTCVRGRPLQIFSSVLFVMITIGMQMMFGFIMLKLIAVDDYKGKFALSDLDNPDVTYNLFEDWFESHSDPPVATVHVNGKGRQTWRDEDDEGYLAKWICKGQSWSFHETKIDDVAKYAASPMGGNLHVGQVFGFFAILMWAGLIIRELRSNMNYALLLFMPRPVKHRPCYEFNKELYAGRITSLPLAVKGVVVLVFLARLCINFSLGIYGLRFLSFTDNLKDFLLNSVALGFVYDIDELAFSAFIAPHKKQAIRNLSPTYVMPHGLAARLKTDMSEGVLLVMEGTIAGFALVKYLIPFSQALIHEFFEEVCPPSHGLS